MVILIATNHFDIYRGYSRLRALLEHIEPSAVSVESSVKKDVEDEQNYLDILSPTKLESTVTQILAHYKEANEDTVRALLRGIGYEVRCAKDYAFSKGIPLIYSLKPSKRDVIDEEIEEQGVENDSVVTVSKWDLHKFQRVNERDYREDSPITSEEYIAYLKDVDEFTFNNLKGEKGNIVHICGLDHLYGNYSPNLYDRFRKANIPVIKTKLTKGDKFLL